MSISDLRQKLGNRIYEGQFGKWERATVGILDGAGNRIVDVPARPNYVWVRLERTTASSATAVLNTKVKATWGLRVWVGPNEAGTMAIMSIDQETMSAEIGKEAQVLNIPDWVTNGPIPARRITPGLVRVTNPVSMSVYIEPFFYQASGAIVYYPGGTLDLTSNVPATGATRRWVLVGVDPTTNTAAAVDGADYGLPVTLTAAMVADIDPAGMIPLAGVNLFAGMSAINAEAMFLDVRFWTQSGGSGGIGDMLKSVYDTDDDGIVDHAALADSATDADTVDGQHAADFAPSDAPYVTLATDAGLANERVLTPGAGLAGADAGAGGAYTLSVDINGQTADATPDGAADYVITYDASAAGLKKVLLNDLPAASGSYLPLDGSDPMTGDLYMGFKAIYDGYRIFLYDNGGAAPVLSMEGDNNLPPLISMVANGATGFPTIYGVRFRGTIASPLSVQLNDVLLGLHAGAYTVPGGNSNIGKLHFYVDDTPSGSSAPIGLKIDLSGKTTLFKSSGEFQTDYAHIVKDISTPANPGAGYHKLYPKSDGFYALDSSGVEVGPLSATPANAQYLTLAANPGLSAERVLTPGQSMVGVDAGANGNYTLHNALKVKNTSGASVAAYAVGYIDSAGEFKTTTTESYAAAWCVVVVGGANNADIYVARSGRVTITLDGNCSAGNYLVTSTTAGQAKPLAYVTPELFAVALTSNVAGAGGTCEALLLCNRKFVPISSTNAGFLRSASSTHNGTAWTGTINDAAPTTNPVTVATTTGSVNTLAQTATDLFKIVVRNTTRGNECRVASVTGNDVTFADTIPANWANGDALTAQSDTNAQAGYYTLDCANSTDIPALAVNAHFSLTFADSAAAGTLFYLHPYQANSSSKTLTITNQVASATIYFRTPIMMQLINRRMCLLTSAGGVGTVYTRLFLIGVEVAEP